MQNKNCFDCVYCQFNHNKKYCVHKSNLVETHWKWFKIPDKTIDELNPNNNCKYYAKPYTIKYFLQLLKEKLPWN